MPIYFSVYEVKAFSLTLKRTWDPTAPPGCVGVNSCRKLLLCPTLVPSGTDNGWTASKMCPPSFLFAPLSTIETKNGWCSCLSNEHKRAHYTRYLNIKSNERFETINTAFSKINYLNIFPNHLLNLISITDKLPVKSAIINKLLAVNW